MVSISHNNKKVAIPSVTVALIISHHNHMAITSANDISDYIDYDNNIVTTNINKLAYHMSTTKMVKTITFGKHIQTNIVKNNIPHTASKLCVLESITFSHTPEEAMLVGLVKVCFL